MGKANIAAGLGALLAGAAMQSPAHAAVEEAQAWTAATASTDLSESVVITLEGQLRMTDGADRLGQVLVRPSIGLKLDPTTTVSLGYAYVYTDPIGPAQSDEHRLWQQVAFRVVGDGQGITLTGRSRLEQRWIEGSDDMGWRLRQQFRATAPLAGKVRAVAWSEAFVAFDDTDWGQNSGLDRWRNSVGVLVPVADGVTVEPGYINQWVIRPGQDRVHHIANVSVSARF